MHYSPTTAHILRIPNEIQLKIIHLFLDDALSPVEDMSMIYKEIIKDVRAAGKASTDVTHVCHKWRAIARNDPSIWSRIVISIVTDDDLRNLQWFSEMVDTHITLSQKLSVTIKITFTSPKAISDHTVCTPHWDTILMNLTAISPRWHSFETTTISWDPIGRMIWHKLRRTNLFLPALQHLTLDTTLFDIWMHKPVTPLDSCQSLTTVVEALMGHRFLADRPGDHPSVKTADLRILDDISSREAEDQALYSCILLLPFFPNLVSLNIRIPVYRANRHDEWNTIQYEALDFPMTRIRLAQLEELFLWGFESYRQPSIDAFLPFFDTPLLNSFLCKGPCLRNLPDFLQRSHGSLTSLQICIDPTQPELPLDDSLLQHLPRLTTLGLSAIPGTSTDEAVQKLKDPWVLPELEDLTLEVLYRARDMGPGYPKGFTQGFRLLEIVEARGQRLKRLCASAMEERQRVKEVKEKLESYRGKLKCKVTVFCKNGYRKTVRVGWEGQKPFDGWMVDTDEEYESDVGPWSD